MMQKLYKLFLCALLIPLVGCHGASRSTTFEVPEEFDTSKNYEITFWAKNDTNKNQVAVYKNAIASFEEAYPNIKVNLKLYTDYIRIYNDVITNIATGTTPDVCITYPDHIATYITGNNVVVPLDDIMQDEKYGFGGSEVNFKSVKQEEVVPQYLQEGVLGETQYALPFMRSTEAIYINQDFVEALGYEVPEIITWDFIWEVSEKATAKNPDGTYVLNGQNVMIPFIYKSTDNMMIQYLQQADAGYSSSEGEIEIFNDTTGDFLKTISTHVPTGAFSTFKISSYPANFLDAGQCVFAVDSTAGSTWMGADAPLSDISEENKVAFTTAVRPVPQIDSDHIQMISQGPSICLFNKKDPQQVLASWLFAQYLLTEEVQVGYAQTEGYIPVTKAAQQSDAYQEYLANSGIDNDQHYSVKMDATKMLLDHIDDTFVTSVFNGSASLRTAAGQLIEDVVKSSKRKETIDETYLDSLYAKTTSLYRLDEVARSNQSNLSDADLGPLPAGSKALLATLGIAWVCIAVYFFVIRKNK